MILLLQPGEQITVTFAGTDGEVTVEYNEDSIKVLSDEPDDDGRTGIIYDSSIGPNADDAGNEDTGNEDDE
jgi:hypothetical protein